MRHDSKKKQRRKKKLYHGVNKKEQRPVTREKKHPNALNPQNHPFPFLPPQKSRTRITGYHTVCARLIHSILNSFARLIVWLLLFVLFFLFLSFVDTPILEEGLHRFNPLRS